MFEISQRNRLLPMMMFHNHTIRKLSVNALVGHYQRWMQDANQFTILRHSQLLDLSTKRRVLQIDASLQQNQRVQQSVLQSLVSGVLPDARTARNILRVRRSHLLEDALSQVRIAETINTLKLPLMVEFEGEPAVDAGGVKKEFFQVTFICLFFHLLDFFSTKKNVVLFCVFNKVDNESFVFC